MTTTAQRKERTSNVAKLRQAILDQPREHLAARAYAILADVLSADDLERLGNNLGRAGHQKARERQ